MSGSGAARRPDKAAAKVENALKNEKVVPVGFATHVTASLHPSINERVFRTSKRTNLAGLIAYETVLTACTSWMPFPILNDAFFISLLTEPDHSKFDTIRWSYETKFKGVIPVPQRQPGDANTLKYAADQMRVNFFNTMTEAFEPRLDARIKVWADEDKKRIARIFAVKKAICRWGVQEPSGAVLGEAAFIESERSALGNPEKVSKEWLKAHYELVLRTYWRWLSTASASERKTFTLMPFFKVKRHYIQVDSRVLHGILSESGVFSDVKTNNKTRRLMGSPKLQWKYALELYGLVTRKWSFTGVVSMDGVTVNPHFRAYKTQEELQAIQDSKDANAKNCADKEAYTALLREDPEEAERRLKASRSEKRAQSAAKLKAKKEAAKVAPPPGQAEWCRFDIPEGVLSEDPGSNPNLLSGVYKTGGKLKRKVLTKGQYMTEGGVRKAHSDALHWMKGIKHAQDKLNEESVKTADPEAFDRYLQVYAEVYDTLWDEKLKRRWARNRFGTHIRKPAALDSHFRQLKADGAGTRAAYIGGGRWSPSQKGRETTPVDIVSRRFRRYFSHWDSAKRQHVSYAKTVAEQFTSQCCFKCGCRTREVYEQVISDPTLREENKKNKEGWKNDRLVRGLRFCDSKSCGCLIDRDFQGAMNIMGLGLAEDSGKARPTHLTHETEAMKRTSRFFLSSRSSVCLGKRKLIFPYSQENANVLCHSTGLVPL
jgi:hypothetical protein